MIGPVFALEWMRTGRRTRAHVLRWICGCWLLVQFLIAYSSYLENRKLGDFAQSFLDSILLQQFLVVVLITPGLAAGTLTEEKTRGTLDYLLTTELGSGAIIVGKLLARITDVIVLTLAVLPMAAFVAPYAGAGFTYVFAQATVAILTALGLSGLSMLASVWIRQTGAAVFAVYVFVLAAAGFYVSGLVPLPGWVRWWDPIWALTPAREGSAAGEIVGRLGRFALAWGAFGAACTIVAVWRLRPAYSKQLAARSTWLSWVRRLSRPAPAWNPLEWKERFVGRRLPRWVGLAAVAALTIWAAYRQMHSPASIAAGQPVPVVDVISFNGWFAIALSMLMVGVTAAGTVSGERERRTWDGLLTTPMTFRELVRGKLRGVLAAAWPYLMTYLLASAALAVFETHSSLLFAVSYGFATTALAVATAVVFPRMTRPILVALALAWGLLAGLPVFLILLIDTLIAWLGMEFFGSVGLWCSVRCASSWRSLLMTVGLGCAGGVVLTCVSTPIAGITAIVLYLFAMFFEMVTGWGADPALSFSDPSEFAMALVPLFFAIGVALTFRWVARSLMIAAVEYLALVERISTGRAPVFRGGVRIPRRPVPKAVRRG